MLPLRLMLRSVATVHAEAHRDRTVTRALRRNSRFGAKVRESATKRRFRRRTTRRRARAPPAAPPGSTRPSPSATCAARPCRSRCLRWAGWIQIRTLTSPPASSPNTMPTFSEPSMATSQAASSASTRSDGGADLVVEVAGGRARAVACRTHVVGARGEDVAVLVGRERPQHQVLSRARRLLAHREAELVVEVLEFGGDPAPRDLGEPVERQPEHRFGGDQRRAKHRGDRLDGGVVVLGFHDDVEQLVPPFERADQRVGDLPASPLCGRGRSWREA